MLRRRTQQIRVLATLFVFALGVSSAALAADHVRGVVTGRGGDGSLLVRTDTSDVVIVLDENTKVRETSGLRSIKVELPSLVPGLRVDVEGNSLTDTRFMADRVRLSRDRYPLRLIPRARTPAVRAR